MKGVKQTLFRFMPPSMRLPFWYHLHVWAGMAEDEILGLKSMVPSRKMAVDIGANIGLFSYVLARLCPQVQAFEPQPDCAAVLRAYGAKNVIIHPCGLSDQVGEMTLGIPVVNGVAVSGLASFRGGAGTGDSKQIQVAVKRLDDFDFQSVGFVKIDVEGHEIEVLRGAEKTLKRERPNLLIEIEQRHLDFPMTDIFQWISERGYRGYFLEKSRERPIEEFSFAEFQEPYLKDVLAENYRRIRGKYINNFLFRPASTLPT